MTLHFFEVYSRRHFVLNKMALKVTVSLFRVNFPVWTISSFFEWRQDRLLSLRLTAILDMLSHGRPGQGRKGETQHIQSQAALNVYALGFLHTPYTSISRPKACRQLLASGNSQQIPTTSGLQGIFSAELSLGTISEDAFIPPPCDPRHTRAHNLHAWR